MNIAYVTTYDATDVHQWSGTPTNMARALATGDTRVHFIGNLNERYGLPLRGGQYLIKRLLGKDYLRQRSDTITAGYAGQIKRRLSAIPADIVFSPGTLPVCRLDSETPIVVWTDATFASMIDFYPGFSNLHPRTIADGHRAEQAALHRCALAIYSSDWAAQSAITDYAVDPAKVKVVPFGANLENVLAPAEVRRAIDSRPATVCKLLFIGVEWARKGGDTALQVVQALNRQGVPAELTLIGCAPPSGEPLPDYVKSLGFVSKAGSEGQRRMTQILAESHFLIIPSRADCTPIVLNEANALGVPCLTTDVGGIPSVITNHVNGYAFPLAARDDEYVTYIARLMQDYPRYRDLAHSAYGEYQRRLNWGVSGTTVRRLIRDLVR